jgi:hypothetical protein
MSILEGRFPEYVVSFDINMPFLSVKVCWWILRIFSCVAGSWEDSWGCRFVLLSSITYYTKSHVLEYKTPEQISYHLNLFATQPSTNTKLHSVLLFSLLITINLKSWWQFPKGDVPKWVHNAMEVAGIDISECCTPTNCQHDAMEETVVDISEFCPPTKCPWQGTFRGYLYSYHTVPVDERKGGRRKVTPPYNMTSFHEVLVIDVGLTLIASA